MERHSESLGNALQHFYRDIFPATCNSVQILLAHPDAAGQFFLSHFLLFRAFFKSNFVSFFMLIFLKFSNDFYERAKN
jgi:hypothetical protein